MGSLSELLLERMQLVERAQVNMHSCIEGKRDALAQEARLAMPKQWARHTNMIGRLTNIQSDHDREAAEAVRHLIDGNVMGLHEVVSAEQQDAYLDGMLASDAAPIQQDQEPIAQQREDGSLNPAAFELLVSDLARPTDDARDMFERMAA